MKEQIHFRTVRDADRDRLYTIWEQAVEATHDFLTEEDRAKIAALVKEHYTAKAELLVAVHDEGGGETLLGFMGLTGAHIDALFIAPEAFGSGVGKAFIAEAQRLSGPAITVDVNEQNEGAVGFYKHVGFVQTGRSETDDDGRPYPLLHLKLETAVEAQ